MPRPGCSLTPYQVRIMGAVAPGGSRALEIAGRSGLRCEVIYPALARMVRNDLLAKDSSSRVPVYRLTADGARQLEASRAYQERLRAS